MREAFASLFLYLQKKYLMKIYYYFIIAILFFSCKQDEVEPIIYDNNYGEGVYITSDQGISFYNGSTIMNNIYNEVNNTLLVNPKKVKFGGEKGYIIDGDRIIIIDVNTFEHKGIISGFINPVDLEVIYGNRLFVVDKGDSRLKEVDLYSLDVMSTIETGDSTRPTFIVSNSIRSFVMNGGGAYDEIKDSTVISVDYKDGVVSIAEIVGNILLADNPNSGVIFNDRLKVLCKGKYDPSGINNIESSFCDINQYTNKIYSINSLAGLYNANNLINASSNGMCYFTASGGIYSIDPNNLNFNLVLNIETEFLATRVEKYPINDTTFVYPDILYLNDINSPNQIYKYNLLSNNFIDTIVIDGNVRQVNFY